MTRAGILSYLKSHLVMVTPVLFRGWGTVTNGGRQSQIWNYLHASQKVWLKLKNPSLPRLCFVPQEIRVVTPDKFVISFLMSYY